jgi:hypothetical protein
MGSGQGTRIRNFLRILLFSSYMVSYVQTRPGAHAKIVSET